jgi:hypothetical protein
MCSNFTLGEERTQIRFKEAFCRRNNVGHQDRGQGALVVRRTGTVAKNWISSATSSNRSSRRTHEEIKRPEM